MGEDMHDRPASVHESVALYSAAPSVAAALVQAVQSARITTSAYSQ